ncbi:hypothetical protein EVAR_20760_1 [Eumeta japonica]|uniref:Uncharacterized protein n=1 Tax=Eumeta variegata TaxID=151549 RepID=A0A4C1VAQ5_EUMVA|nr:hypothetical protein EVAR_20760_1 [Eumeta japonica]
MLAYRSAERLLSVAARRGARRRGRRRFDGCADNSRIAELRPKKKKVTWGVERNRATYTRHEGRGQDSRECAGCRKCVTPPVTAGSATNRLLTRVITQIYRRGQIFTAPVYCAIARISSSSVPSDTATSNAVKVQNVAAHTARSNRYVRFVCTLLQRLILN